MDTTNVRWPDSLWAAVNAAGARSSGLIGTQQADVIVIGAGFTGLSTALHLRESAWMLRLSRRPSRDGARRARTTAR